MSKYKIAKGDCLQKLGGGVTDNSVDLIVTDPPYNISKDNRLKSMGRSGIDLENGITMPT